MVMVSNLTNLKFAYLAGKYEGRIGHLYSPGAQPKNSYSFFPYALDNGAYGAFKNAREWDENGWRALLAWAAAQPSPPLWALAPDVVQNRDATLRMWDRFSPVLRLMGLRSAFAVQDGMQFADVPTDDCVLFLGGSTEWKLTAIAPWCARFPGRVHIGRVNTGKRLKICAHAGAVSVDGTGWWHDEQYTELSEFLAGEQ
jgi:hypothetical protein